MTSISEYTGGCSVSLDQHFLKIKVSSKERLIHMKDKNELNRVLKYLDAALKVSEA